MTPNLTAFLMVLRHCEGTADANGYRCLFTYHPARNPGAVFDSYRDHPRRKMTSGKYVSSAAGAYQILERTWDWFVRVNGQHDFSPESQDLCARWLIGNAKATADVEAGRLRDALAKCAKTWASLPGSPYGQPTRSYEYCERVFLESGGILSRKPSLPPIPNAGTTVPKTRNAPIPQIPVEQPKMPFLPILISLIPEVIKLFAPRVQGEIERVTGADSNTSGAFMQSLADKIAGQPVTTAPQAIAAVASVVDAPPEEQADKVAELEAFSVDYVDRMRPLIDRIAQLDAEAAERVESSRNNARSFTDPESWKLRWAQTTFTQKALGASALIVALLIAIMTVALIWLPQDARAAVYNLLGQLIVVLVTTIGLLGATFRDQNGFSFGGTSDGEARAVARSVADKAK